MQDQHWGTCTAKASPGLEKQPGEQLRRRPGWAGGARPDTGTAVPRRTSPAPPAEPTKLPAATATKTTRTRVHILPHSLPPTAPVLQGPGWARDSPDWHKTRLGTNAGKTNRNSSAAAPSIWLHGRRASAGVTPQMQPPPVPPVIPTPLERRERQAEGEEAASSRQETSQAGNPGQTGRFSLQRSTGTHTWGCSAPAPAASAHSIGISPHSCSPGHHSKQHGQCQTPRHCQDSGRIPVPQQQCQHIPHCLGTQRAPLQSLIPRLCPKIQPGLLSLTHCARQLSGGFCALQPAACTGMLCSLPSPPAEC